MKLSVLELGVSTSQIRDYMGCCEKISQIQSDLGINEQVEFCLKQSRCNSYRDSDQESLRTGCQEIIGLKSYAAQIIVPEIVHWNPLLEIPEGELREWQDIARTLFALHSQKTLSFQEAITLNQQGDFLFGQTSPYAQKLCEAVTKIALVDPETEKALTILSTQFSLSGEEIQMLIDTIIQESNPLTLDRPVLDSKYDPFLKILRRVFLRKVTLTKDIQGRILPLFENF